MSTIDHTTEIAATLARLASMLAEQQHQEEARESEKELHTLPNRVLLNIDEAAQQLGIGRTKTYALIKSGDLESVQIGRLRRVPRSAIDEYAARLVAEQITQKHAA